VKRSILFILHLPPPVHGASIASQYIRDSVRINDTFNATYINLMTADSLTDVGRGSWKKLLVFAKIVAKVFTSLSKNKYDLCYITLNVKGFGFYKDFIVIMLAKLFNQNIIYHFHNKGVSTRSPISVRKLLYKLVFKNSKSILSSSHLYYDISEFAKPENVLYCPLGIPIANPIQPIKKSNAVCKLLYLGNMMEHKGVYILLEACRVLKESFALHFECHFVGDWADISEDQFRKKVSAYGLAECVFTHGKKYGSDKHFFYENADIFVFPTYYHSETFGIVNLEAMQFSLPIVSTYNGGIPDAVLDGKTGYLVPQKDVAKLAEQLRILILDPSLRKQMGHHGHLHFKEHFTLKKYEDNLISIFEEVT
jgi:glycosyltransferase involved in cell wall biosynthesis